MTDNNELLTAARFEDKLRTYWYLQTVLICFATIVGIVILPVWLLGFGLWYVRRSFEALKCELYERTLVVKRGIFFKVEKTIPLDKIQDLTVKEGPLLRKLGLRSLKIETAGQGTPGASEADLIGIVDPIDFRDRVLRQRDSMSLTPVGQTGAEEGTSGTIELLTEIRDLLSQIAGRG
ncbi:PH domain-containing protein [Gemmatimonadota bacterium]